MFFTTFIPLATILLLLYCCFLAAQALSERWKHKKMEAWLSQNGPTLLIALGAVISLAGTIWAAYQQNVAQVQIAKSITGGDNFCYVTLGPGGPFEHHPMMLAVNEGDYPLYDISFRMWDPADYDNDMENMTIEDINKNSYNIDVGNLAPHSVKTLGRIELPDALNAKNFEVSIIARNGAFTEQIRLRRVNGAWKRAYRIFSGYIDSSNKLLERSDPDFPRDNNGQIQW